MAKKIGFFGAVCVVIILIFKALLGQDDMQNTAALVFADSGHETTNNASVKRKTNHEVASGFASQKDIMRQESMNLALKDLPASISDTQMDGWIGWTDDGRLEVSGDTVRLVEYFFTTLGEETYEQIQARLRHLINALPENVRAEARDLLDRYLEYRQKRAELPLQAASGGPENIEQLRTTFTQISQLRKEVFGENLSDTLFGDNERYTQYSLDVMAFTEQNIDMPEIDKIKYVRARAESLPEEYRQPVMQALEQREMMARIEHVKREGGDAEQIMAIRREFLGENAAQALADFDALRVKRKTQLADFNAVFSSDSDLKLPVNTPMTEQAKQTMRDLGVAPNEQPRLWQAYLRSQSGVQNSKP